MNWIKLLGPVLLYLLPLLVLVGAGAWGLWESGRWAWLFWLFPVCWGAAWWWRRSVSRATRVDLFHTASSPAWTPRDEQAWQVVVKGELQRAQGLTLPQLQLPATYEEATTRLASELAQHYAPGSQDPLSQLTVVELLTATTLAIRDLERDVRQYLPAAHLMTIGHWRGLGRLSSAAAPLSQLWTATSLGLAALSGDLISVGSRLAAGQLVLNPASSELAEALAPQIFGLYVRRVAFYLIELYSGRLRQGADRYDEFQRQLHARSTAASPTQTPATTIDHSLTGAATKPITIVVAGQTNAGKSSLINSLLGETRAAMDVLSTTWQVDRYTTQPQADLPPLVLLDTPGYQAGPAGAMSRAALVNTMSEADILIWVIASTHPAREADREAIAAVQAHFAANHQLKRLPELVALTKVDQLSPRAEWNPPYEWLTGSRRKEETMREAAAAVLELWNGRQTPVFPVVNPTADGPAWGVDETLWPAIQLNLGEARSVQLVRQLHADWPRERAGLFWSQATQLGTQAARTLLRPEVLKSLIQPGPARRVALAALATAAKAMPPTPAGLVTAFIAAVESGAGWERLQPLVDQLREVLGGPTSSTPHPTQNESRAFTSAAPT